MPPLCVRGRAAFIRRTAVRSRATGEPYYTCPLVESVRTGGITRQATVLNLGGRFEVRARGGGPLAQRPLSLTLTRVSPPAIGDILPTVEGGRG
jgi:hypothetical protein